MKYYRVSVLLLAAILVACGGGGKGFDNSANVKNANSMIKDTFENQGFKVTDMHLTRESQTKLKGNVIMTMSGAKAEVMCDVTIDVATNGIAFKCK
jgi:hypothetical protein